MSKTAIVPVAMAEAMRTAGIRQKNELASLSETYTAMLAARPPVPDELIEEAAKAIYAYFCKNVLTLFTQAPWDEISESSREHFRKMARAAARVFNGGKDE